MRCYRQILYYPSDCIFWWCRSQRSCDGCLDRSGARGNLSCGSLPRKLRCNWGKFWLLLLSLWSSSVEEFDLVCHFSKQFWRERGGRVGWRLTLSMTTTSWHIAVRVFIQRHSLFRHSDPTWGVSLQDLSFFSALWQMRVPRGSPCEVRASSDRRKRSGPGARKYDRYGSLLFFSKGVCYRRGLAVIKWWISFGGMSQ